MPGVSWHRHLPLDATGAPFLDPSSIQLQEPSVALTHAFASTHNGCIVGFDPPLVDVSGSSVRFRCSSLSFAEVGTHVETDALTGPARTMYQKLGCNKVFNICTQHDPGLGLSPLKPIRSLPLNSTEMRWHS